MLHQTITALHPLLDSEFELLEAICHERHYAKGEHLLWNGDVCRGLFFIESGAVGLYGMRDGKEVYQNFFLEGTFATDIASLVSQESSSLFLIALEETAVRYIGRDDLLGLYERSPAFQHLGRKMLERLLVQRTELSVRQTTLSSAERYDYLVTYQAELLKRVPLQYLATYLGMTRETLSRIRRRK